MAPPPPSGGGGWGGSAFGATPALALSAISEMESCRSAVLRKAVGKKCSSAPAPVSFEERVTFERAQREEEEEADAQLATVEHELAATTVGFVGYAAADMGGSSVVEQQAVVADELTTLLGQLAKEPKLESEMVAKFALYENLQRTVAAVRDTTMAFWSENADQFVGASKASATRDIAAIDSGEAMGIQDDPRKWFVYSMAVKANQNSTLIGRTLAQLRTRLELLAQEAGECPCCLENITAANCTILGCCHKMCSDCWENWAELKGADAFCPLCKHHEFVSEVFAAGV